MRTQKHFQLIVSAMLILFASSPAGYAATFDTVYKRTFREWVSLLFVNRLSGIPFCAAETQLENGSIFRINFYSMDNAFLEIFPNPTDLPHDATFLTFASDDFDLRTVGIINHDAVIFELNRPDIANAILKIVSDARALYLLDTNSEPLFSIPVAGSKAAINDFVDCTRTVHLLHD